MDISLSSIYDNNLPVNLAYNSGGMVTRDQASEEFQALLLKQIYLNSMYANKDTIFNSKSEEEKEEEQGLFSSFGSNDPYNQVIVDSIARDLSKKNILGLKTLLEKGSNPEQRPEQK